ncbi:BMP family lipoprotein [Stackebrandtia nassauensis]|uniref:Basic membrane lipoprotein n=1 Tax=Stackebrandtia nassauensis (strain DSM 44728 / CIP 108903 / NRRL B-16338 / NBRC 102104 / LLR-40K-21) TaxID=446470 RepID=D3PUB4_STANL|nr:BMP family ABC transporter substrate-binding protein [Stackebrandtia nassauensis]ADD41060.1 basic membrane lipoprotein [Stackebrandtia nassauensis DSM 44728]
MRKWRGPRKFAALVVASGVALTGLAACGEASDAGFVVCMVSDEGGFDDKSFNESAWAGMEKAKKENSEITLKKRESKDKSDYSKNLTSCVKDDKADLTIAVGGLITGDTEQVAEENKDKRFAIVDSNLSGAKNKNVFSMEFNTAQSSFLAGYLAAGTSKTGKVGTFGGANIPPVTIFMDGYAEGVEYYNKQNKKDVQVKGWKPNFEDGKGDGLFVDNFEDAKVGKQHANNLMSQGADVIFPVAGPAGLGGPEATQSKDDVYSIWVDSDGCEAAAKYCDEFLTSSMKGIADAVAESIKTAVDDGAKDGRYVGTLENEGVGLADLNKVVDEKLAKEIETVKKDIIDGKIEIKSKNQPKPE